MLQHALKHQGKVYACSKCVNKRDSPYNLEQHMKGYHGDGWLMPCGEREQWPSLVVKHKKCKDCKAIELKKIKKTSQIGVKNVSQKEISVCSPISTMELG